MRLADLLTYEEIVIQSHDNPDADSLASGFALYSYFKLRGKNVRFIYSGSAKIQKSNLRLMIEKLSIPIEYVSKKISTELLVVVDSQYGTGNISRHIAKEVAMIDHHQMEINSDEYRFVEIRSNLGSCSTLVWYLLQQEGFQVNQNINIATALFYGLYTDTGQLGEVFHPLDRDMRDSLQYDKTIINKLKNSNISLRELEIAGQALLRYVHSDIYRYAIIKVKPCDSNILGLISDFLLQVDCIDTCLVFNQMHDGIKLSVRSCIKEVKACELVQYLVGVIGSGGGHDDKAGGFIQERLLREQYGKINYETFFKNRLNQYFRSFTVIDAANYPLDTSEMQRYCKRKVPVGYVRLSDYIKPGTPVLIRDFERDLETTIKEGVYVIIGLYGEITFMNEEKFHEEYCEIDKKVEFTAQYMPVVKNLYDEETFHLENYIRACTMIKKQYIFARPLEIITKLFTVQDAENYMYGDVGDYIAVNEGDQKNIFIVNKDVFQLSYTLIPNEY